MLMAFESAARTGSFTAAANELNLTQSAVSRQVKSLEDQLNIELFRRVKKEIHLTETGSIYHKEVHSALNIIRNASLNAITSPLNGVLNLAILPTFGTRWLMPKLSFFLDENPNVTVNFVTKLSPFDFANENLHAAIHYGSPNWANTESTFLMKEQAIPVCSPDFLSAHSMKSAKDLVNVPLLHLSTRPSAWAKWFESNQLTLFNHSGMLFEQISIISQAAISGLGVALLPKFLIQNELDRGELITVLDFKAQSNSGYYLITPSNKANYPPNVAFRDWLLRTINT
jgi:LysR family glycine cleavage system transcriptional activator